MDKWKIWFFSSAFSIRRIFLEWNWCNRSVHRALSVSIVLRIGPLSIVVGTLGCFTWKLSIHEQNNKTRSHAPVILESIRRQCLPQERARSPVIEKQHWFTHSRAIKIKYILKFETIELIRLVWRSVEPIRFIPFVSCCDPDCRPWASASDAKVDDTFRRNRCNPMHDFNSTTIYRMPTCSEGRGREYTH